MCGIFIIDYRLLLLKLMYTGGCLKFSADASMSALLFPGKYPSEHQFPSKINFNGNHSFASN